MNNALLYLLLLVVLTSCQAKEEAILHNESLEKLTSISSQLDSLQSEIAELKTQLKEKESDNKPAQDTAAATNSNTVSPLPSPKVTETQTHKPKQKEVKPLPQTKSAENDTIFHYYVNGKVSVKIHPWKDSKRKIELFDLYGRQTFETEDIRMSYSVGNTLYFHKNGAVSKIEESMNPGASMYMYYATMTFSTTNDPEVRTSRKQPESLQDQLKQVPEFWDKKARKWVKQEIVIETNSPNK
jgi:outer membrane murein-binding lipoprotein Lpp